MTTDPRPKRTHHRFRQALATSEFVLNVVVIFLQTCVSPEQRGLLTAVTQGLVTLVRAGSTRLK